MAGVEAMEVDNNASEEVSQSEATTTSTTSSKPAPSTGESSKKGSYELPWYVCNASNVMDDRSSYFRSCLIGHLMIYSYNVTC